MATTPIPPPASAPPDQAPGPGGGFASPAPPVEDPNAGVILRLVMGIVANARILGSRVPQAFDEVRTITNAAQSLMGKIKGNQAPTEAQAPPL